MKKDALNIGMIGYAFMGRALSNACRQVGRFFDLPAIVRLHTIFAHGRKNHITLEVNGSAGSLVFDFEDMNRLKFFSAADPAEKQGFRDILVTEARRPYMGNWWPHGHILGYEHTFVNKFADFVKAVVSGKNVQPTFAEGLEDGKVLAAVEESSRTRKWVSV